MGSAIRECQKTIDQLLCSDHSCFCVLSSHLPRLGGMLEAYEDYFTSCGGALFSSHMLAQCCCLLLLQYIFGVDCEGMVVSLGGGGQAGGGGRAGGGGGLEGG